MNDEEEETVLLAEFRTMWIDGEQIPTASWKVSKTRERKVP